MTVWMQKTIRLVPQRRGFHLVTRHIESAIADDLARFKVGLAHVFLHHTSASLTISENADPTVRADFERHFNVMVPEGAPYYEHNDEGLDDMPAHIKASLLGVSVTLPIRNGAFVLGVWQGIYLCEHRDRGGSRTVTVTLNGEAGA